MTNPLRTYETALAGYLQHKADRASLQDALCMGHRARNHILWAFFKAGEEPRQASNSTFCTTQAKVPLIFSYSRVQINIFFHSRLSCKLKIPCNGAIHLYNLLLSTSYIHLKPVHLIPTLISPLLSSCIKKVWIFFFSFLFCTLDFSVHSLKVFCLKPLRDSNPFYYFIFF